MSESQDVLGRIELQNDTARTLAEQAHVIKYCEVHECYYRTFIETEKAIQLGIDMFEDLDALFDNTDELTTKIHEIVESTPEFCPKCGQ